jgi:hypothetical protein
MNRTVAQPQPSIGYKKAIDLMHKHGTRLVRMTSDASPEGFVHYVVPGGHVSPDVADKIKKHPAVSAGSDGLFPGHDQTWRIGT